MTTTKATHPGVKEERTVVGWLLLLMTFTTLVATGCSALAGGPSVDQVPIKVGETNGVPQPTTQRDMNAALVACPEVTGANGEAEILVTLAK